MACSSDQTSNPETTNPDFFFIKMSLFISREFEQIKTKIQFREKRSRFVDSRLGVCSGKTKK